MHHHFILIGLVASVLAAPHKTPTTSDHVALTARNITTESSITAGHPTEPQLHRIPISSSACSGRRFDLKDEDVLTRAITNPRSHRTIGPLSVGVWTYRSSTWYVCNCKFLKTDSFPADEYEQAKAAIADHCGVGYGGWIFSEQWKKGYVMDHTDVLRAVRRCAPGCVLE